ncbi:dehydrogenase E1 component [Micromonospora sp. ATCC 39149]|nr:dehydrogenase E1 component [Micromonospora sp. ATCC 39149]
MRRRRRQVAGVRRHGQPGARRPRPALGRHPHRDQGGSPGVTRDDPVRLYRTVRLIRRFEERAVALVRSGAIVGGIHPYLGQEGIAAGVCAALRDEDLVTGTHRGHGHVLAKGADPARMLAELLGRETGLNRGRGGSMHAADLGIGVLGANAIVGAAGAILTGAVWARRRRGDDLVGATFFGDLFVWRGCCWRRSCWPSCGGCR